MFNSILKLDIFDVNWDVSSETINQVEITSSGRYGIFEGVTRLFFHLTMSILFFKIHILGFKYRIIFFSGTKNQTLALNQLKFKDSCYLKFGNQSNHFRNNSFELFPYIISLLFIPLIIWKFLKEKNSFKRKMLLCRLDRYLFSYGLFTFYSLILHRSKIDVIFLSNDHSVWQRTLVKVCKAKNIKTAYVQHANVSESFPKLEFDYAFLDGVYAKNCYLGSNCNIYLIGCLRFEEFKRNSNNEEGEKVLLCFNRIDTEETIRKCIGHFINLDIDFSVRLHPAESRQAIIRMISTSSFFSDVSNLTLEKVLTNYSYCFSGTSSIFLEASIFGMKCFSIREYFWDYYKFEKNGIVKVFSSIEDVDLKMVGLPTEDAIGLYNYVDYNLRHIDKPSKRIEYILTKDGVI